MAGLQPVLKKVATKLIAKFGREVTHIVKVVGEYNPDEGTENTEVSTTISGFISTYSAKDYAGDFDSSRSVMRGIILGDAPMLTTSKVDVGDNIQIDAQRYNVTISEATPLENGIVMYQCNLRGIS